MAEFIKVIDTKIIFFCLVGAFAVLEDENMLVFTASLNLYHLLLLIFDYCNLGRL